MIKSKKLFWIVSGGAVLIAAWAAFRPELAFVTVTVNESVPDRETQGSPVQTLLAAGNFHSNAHETRGTASVYQLTDGRRILRFTDFETSNGPDVHIYLVAADDVTEDATVKKSDFVNLGPMKGNKGNQNYDLAADIDLSKYRAVSVWCKRFSVNFGAASLSAPRSGAQLM